MTDTHALQLRNDLIVEVGDVEERSLIKPLALNQHLHQVNQVQSSLQVALVSTDVYHALQHSNRLVQHTLRVSDEISNGQGTSVEVSLQK